MTTPTPDGLLRRLDDVAAAYAPHSPLCADAAAEIRRLQGIVEKLPKTADGVPIVPGMTIWVDAGMGPNAVFEATTFLRWDWDGKNPCVETKSVEYGATGSWPTNRMHTTRDAALVAAAAAEGGVGR